MLGWHIRVFHGVTDWKAAACMEFDEPETAIAVWQTGLGGLNWIDALVAEGRAEHLGYNGGYPMVYKAPAKDLMPPILEGPPLANKRWGYDPGDVLTDKWIGQTVTHREAAARCAPDDWLLVRAWDLS